MKNNLEEIWIQKGSFGYVVVKGKDSNPEWINRPFQVCSIFDKKNELEQELQKTREQLKSANIVIHHVVYNTNDSQGLAYEYLEANLLLK